MQTLSFRGLAEALSGGRSRPATDAERGFWYALIPFEIVGKPVTIIEQEGHITVIYFKDGKLDWMDILSEYSQ